MKVCSKCGIEKELTEFSKDKSKKDGLRGECKSCVYEQRKAYREKNKQKIKAQYQANKEEEKEKARAYRKANKEKVNEKARAYRKANKEKIKAQRKSNYDANKEKINEKNRVYAKANRDKRNGYFRKKRITDPLFKLTGNIRTLIRKSFTRGGWKKNTKTQQILGCDFATLEAHLNDNLYGFIHEEGIYDIDHIIPLATAQTEEDVIRLNHYTNLQLLPTAYNQFIKKDKAWDREHFEQWLSENI